jgi:hypothetical protein
VSGSFSAGPWLHEVEFKIEQFSLSITFSDESTVKIGLGFLVTPATLTEDTPGADTYVIPVYERITIELWGAGAAGAAYVFGLPVGSDLGDDGGDSSLSVDDIVATAGGGKKPSFYYSGYETMTVIRFNGGEGGVATGGHVNIDGARGEAGRFLTQQLSTFGAYGGDAPNGGTGGQRTSGTSVGYGGFVAAGQDAAAPGGGGGGAGYGGQAGPPIGADFTFNRTFGGAGSGAYLKLEFDYMDEGAPEIGSTINFTVGAKGTGPTGDTISISLDGGDGADGRFKVTVGLTPPPPPPDGGQGTAIITGPGTLRVGSKLTAVYAEDDPDGGETDILYQWTRDGVPIQFGTGETYETVPADEGADIGVDVTYTDALGYTETVQADEVGPVLPEARPLDDLLDGLFAAYSTRLLVGTYTGPLIRLRASTTVSSSWGWQDSSSPAVSGKYIRFDFGTPRLVTEAWMHQNTYTVTVGQGVFQWQGSNDASSWTDIGANFTLNGNSTNPAPKQTELNGNATPYRYYQLLGVSGTWANNLVWEIEFKIDDGGETERIGLPGGQSYQNPQGEGVRTGQITVTTTFSATNIGNLVTGKYPEAGKSFWPDYDTGELVTSELVDWYNAVTPLFSGSQFYQIFDQSGSDRHLPGVTPSGNFPLFWDTAGTFYTVPNGRACAQSNGTRAFGTSLDSPQDALYFLEVIQRDTERPIRHWNWAYGGNSNAKAFLQPTSTANDWTDNSAVLLGNGINTGNPRAVTSATFDTDDADAVVWDGGMNASRMTIRRNGTLQLLAVNTPGYNNEAGSADFRWPYPESVTDRQVRVCELVFWDRDVAFEDGEALALYRLDAMLAWLDEMPEPELYVVFFDEAELDATLYVALEGPTLTAEFYDDAYMSAFVDGVDFSFSVSFSDESVMTAVLALEVYPPNVQTVVITLGW